MTADVRPDPTPDRPAAFSMDDFAAALEGQACTFVPGQVVSGKPHEYLSEGVLVDIGGKSPALLPHQETGVGAMGNLAERLPLGVEREFLVAKGPDGDGQVVLSIRLLQLRQSWTQMQEALEGKHTVSVRVTGTNRGGVTVDASGLRGFVPRSHLVEREDLEGLIGQRFEAAVIEVDRERKRLVLSQREAAKAGRMANLKTGDLVDGKITGLRPFGAFVEFEGVSGLLHVKQISQAHVPTLEGLFSLGERIWAIVAEIDEWKGRIALATAPLENYRGEILEHKDTVMAEAMARHAQLYPPGAEEATPPPPSEDAPTAEDPATEAAPAPEAKPAEPRSPIRLVDLKLKSQTKP